MSNQETRTHVNMSCSFPTDMQTTFRVKISGVEILPIFVYHFEFITYDGDNWVVSKEQKTSQSSTPTCSNVNLSVTRQYLEEAEKSWVLNNPTSKMPP